MSDELKRKILEFVILAKECPENLQEKCFELLLADHLQNLRQKIHISNVDAKQSDPNVVDEEMKEGEDKITPQQEDISITDPHVKVRKFLESYSLTINHINQLFYKEENNFMPLYDDLKTTKASESQIRIALLQSLRTGMQTGYFEFNGESVREEAQARKCYDSANFTAHFKNNKNLFEGFSKYNSDEPTIKLSTEGKAKLAEVIKELQ